MSTCERKASIDAQALGPAASTLAQSIGMDQDKVLTWVKKLSFHPSFPLFLSFFFSLSLFLLFCSQDRRLWLSPASLPASFLCHNRLFRTKKKISYLCEPTL